MKIVFLLLALIALSEAQLSTSNCNNSPSNTNPDRYCAFLMQRSRTQSITINGGYNPSPSWTAEFKMGYPTYPAGDDGNYPMAELFQFSSWSSGCYQVGGFHVVVMAPAQNTQPLQTVAYVYYSGTQVYSPGASQQMSMHSLALSWNNGYYYQAVNGGGAASYAQGFTYQASSSFASIGGLSPQCAGGYGVYETLDGNFTEFRMWSSYVGQQSSWASLIDTNNVPSGLAILYQADKTCGLNLIDLSGHNRYGTLVNYVATDIYSDCSGQGSCNMATGHPVCVCSSSNYYGLACEHTSTTCSAQTCSGNCVNGICVGPPTAPGSVSTSSITGTSVVVTWTPPSASSSAITSWVVEYYSASVGTVTFYSGLPSSYSVTITGLLPSTAYQVIVYAVNSYGSGPTAVASITTPVTAPFAPTMSTSVTITPTSLGVSWTAPSNNGGSAVVGYTLYYATTGTSSPSCAGPFTQVNVTSGTSYTVTGLTSLNYYCFMVYAFNAIGFGPASATVSYETAAYPPNAPAAPTFTAIQSFSLIVSWAAPTSQLSITYYTLYRAGSDGVYSTVYTGTATSFSDSGLVHDSSYTYYLTATSAAGTSSAGAVGSVTTLAAPPTASSFSGYTSTATTVTVSWNAPSDNGGAAITSYGLYFSTDGRTWSNVYTGLSTSFTETGLYRSTQYLFQVVATNAAGLTSTSANYAVWTATTVPSAPTESSSSVTSSTATITLTVADNGGSAISYYTIYESTDGVTFVSVYSSSSATFSASGLNYATTYYFYATATNAVGDSAISSTISFTTSPIVPAAPSLPTSSAITYTTIDLTWTESNNGGSAITAYNLYQSIDNVNFAVVYTGTTAEFLVTGLSTNTNYYFYVTATNVAGTSTFSATATFNTLFQCSSGTYPTGPNTCTQCITGTFSHAGAQYCTSCPDGTQPNGKGASACTTCQPGYYSTGGASLCTKCPIGKYSASYGASYCLPCPQGTFTNVTGMTSCYACDPGFWANPGSSACGACKAGYFANTPSTGSCLQCPAGTYAPNTGSAECAPCPVNTYATYLGTTVCSSCATGKSGPAGSNSILNCN